MSKLTLLKIGHVAGALLMAAGLQRATSAE
jgi:hypothetical protein